MNNEVIAPILTGKFKNKAPGAIMKKETTSAAARRLPEVDGLRGIAILLVVSFHYLNNQLVNSNHFLGKTLGKATAFGWMGVDLFFVLSGFLIGSVLFRNRNSGKYFSTFYARRILRIIPNYYLLVLVFLGILSLPYFSNNYFIAGNMAVPWWSYLAMVHNFYMASLNNMGNPAMSITWSIAIEEQFYLVIPFIIYVIKPRYIPYLLCIPIIAACLLRWQYSTWVPTYVLLSSRMDALSFGILISWMNHFLDLRKFAAKWFRLLLVVAAADVSLCGYLYYRYGDIGVIKHSLFAVFFSIMLLFALTHTKTLYSRLLRNKILTWVGTISYSLYLFHYLILGLFHHIRGHHGGVGIYDITDIWLTVAAFLFSLCFSWVVYKALETPMVNFGKRFKY